MSHSDDVSGAVIGISSQATQKGVETAQHVIDKTIDNIAKLLQALYSKKEKHGTEPEVTGSDMTNIESGEVDIKELIADAKENGDTVVSTDGYSKDDMNFITDKANEYGIPVAFTGKGGEDNICGHVRGCDKPIFERICTEMMQDKLKARPQELDNFKAERWEIDGIQRELSKHDLNANWGKTKDGEHFCLFEKADKKAILMARSEFVRKCDEVENGLTITKDDEGFYNLKDESSGKIITFDNTPSKSELAEMFQEKFGYDENKADIACCKFGENHLDGKLKRDYFGNVPHKEFYKIEPHLDLVGENILVKDYDCLRVTPKADGVPCIVFRDKDNNFAVLNPEKMTRSDMADKIHDFLGIKDEETINALAEKADKVNDFYVKQNNENFVLNRKETIGDIKNDGTLPDVMTEVQLKSIIERLNKDQFRVMAMSNSCEYNVGTASRGEEVPNNLTIRLSFSDKKTALSELQKMYKSQGLSDDVAKQAAKETFKKAQAQSAEKVLQIEEIKVDKQSAEVHGTAKTGALDSVVTVRYGTHKEDIDMTDREKSLAEIGDKFRVSEDEAEKVLDKAQEKIEAETNTAKSERSTTNDKTDKPINGHERNPAEKVDLNAKPDKPDIKADISMPKATPKKRK
jgi:hypothetical protein